MKFCVFLTKSFWVSHVLKVKIHHIFKIFMHFSLQMLRVYLLKYIRILEKGSIRGAESVRLADRRANVKAPKKG